MQGSSLHCAVVEDVLVDGLQTSDLHQAWGAVFKHVALRGKIGRLIVTPLIGSRYRDTPEQEAFDRDRTPTTRTSTGRWTSARPTPLSSTNSNTSRAPSCASRSKSCSKASGGPMTPC